MLTNTPSGGSACESTGGTGQFTADTASCNGTVWSGTQLSGVAGTAESLTSTFASVGASNPSSATLATGGPGLEVTSDATTDGDSAYPMGAVTFAASGPLSASAVSFNGSTGMLETPQLINDPSGNLTLSAWFKVASGYSSGGGIIGFQSTQSGIPSSGWDRHVWMDNSGHIDAGEVTTGGTAEVATSSGTYNNGAWHYVVASFNTSSGLTIYVDGSSVATNSSATSGQNYAGYWTIGYATLQGWTPLPSSYYLNGSLAEVAVFPFALTSGEQSTIYNSGTGTEAAFETRVEAQGPSQYWPLQSPATTTILPYLDNVPDISGNNNTGNPNAGVSQSNQGPFGSDGAMDFDGVSGSSYIETTTDSAALPSAFSIAAWFRAPSGSTAGGSIVGFDTSQAGGGSAHGPLIWMDNSGKIVAGTYTSANKEATSSSAYNNGAWHFVVVTINSSGMDLYVDGSLAGSNSSGTSGGSSGGYWLAGYGDESGWTDAPTDADWTGELAHVAYFASALSSGQITTLDGEGSVGAFESGVLADSPTYYWPLVDSGTTESAGDTFLQIESDSSSSNDNATAVGSSVALGVPGPYSSSYAAGFDGATGYLETSAYTASPPDTFSLVAWFKAPSHSTGGGIIGFDSAQNGTGNSHDRTVWMDDSGKIVAGISGGSGVEATSSSTYDNNAWHLVVAVFTSSTLTVYVDGSQVANVTSGISDASYGGYWAVGWANNAGWTDAAATNEWDGSLADVAVIPSAISSGTDTTIHGEASQSALATELLSLSPTAYWQLAGTATNVTDAGDVEVSLQAANNGTTTCLFPAGSGSCPSLNETDFMTVSSFGPAAPSAAHSTTLTFTCEEPYAAPAPFAGLNFVIPVTLSGALDGWTASLSYAYAVLLL